MPGPFGEAVSALLELPGVFVCELLAPEFDGGGNLTGVPLLSAAGDCCVVEPLALIPLSTLTAGECTMLPFAAVPASVPVDCARANPLYANPKAVSPAIKKRVIVPNPHMQLLRLFS